jgi:tripartite-type tricarboxylate transporter receptor subunit TctC
VHPVALNKENYMKKRLCLLAIAFHLGSFAQTFPSKSVHIVVPFAAGSSTDLLGRLLADELRASIGGTWVVENKAGAGGMIGAQAVAAAAPDGYTLLLSSSATHSSAPGLYKTMPYDPVKGFVHIGRAVLYPWALVVNAALPIKTVAELNAYAKARPGELNYGYGSSTAQVAASAYNSMAGVKSVGVSYKSQPPAVMDLLAGNIQYMFADIGLVAPHIKSGKVKVLGVTTQRPTSVLPDVAPIGESGVAGYQLVGWAGLAAPAGTPSNIIKRLSTELDKVLAIPRVREKLVSMGTEPAPLDGERFNAFVVGEAETWIRRLSDAGVEKQ